MQDIYIYQLQPCGFFKHHWLVEKHVEMEMFKLA